MGLIIPSRRFVSVGGLWASVVWLNSRKGRRQLHECRYDLKNCWWMQGRKGKSCLSKKRCLEPSWKTLSRGFAISSHNWLPNVLLASSQKYWNTCAYLDPRDLRWNESTKTPSIDSLNWPPYNPPLFCPQKTKRGTDLHYFFVFDWTAFFVSIFFEDWVNTSFCLWLNLFLLVSLVIKSVSVYLQRTSIETLFLLWAWPKKQSSLPLWLGTSSQLAKRLNSLSTREMSFTSHPWFVVFLLFVELMHVLLTFVFLE